MFYLRKMISLYNECSIHIRALNVFEKASVGKLLNNWKTL